MSQLVLYVVVSCTHKSTWPAREVRWLTMAPQDKIADAPAKNRFVAALVAHPCACACGIFVLAVVVSIIGPMTLIASGDDLFASEGSYDIHHVTAETQVQFVYIYV